MVQERFPRQVSRFAPSSDTRGSSNAPAGSGQQANPLDTAIQQQRTDFGIAGDVISQNQQRLAQELSLDRPKNFLDKSILAGTKWGVVDVGGVKFVNPLKTVFSGLEAVQTEVASPISGLVIGNTSVWLSQITNWSSAEKIATDFRKKMDAVDGGFWAQRSALKEFNENRQALFWGEKFVSSILADPTTYLGFGWATKLPKIFKPLGLAGKQVPILGPLEKGWVDAWNFPFKVGARAYRGETLFQMPNYFGASAVKLPGVLGKGVPMSASQAARQHGSQVAADFTEFLRQSSGGKKFDQITQADVLGGLAQVLDPTVHYNQLPSDAYRRARDILLESPRMDVKTTQRLIDNLGGSAEVSVLGRRAGLAETPEVKGVIQYLRANADSVLEDEGVRFAMSEVRDLYVRGRIAKGEASEQLARLAGVPLDDVTIKKLEGQLDSWVETTYRNAQFIVDDDTPQGIVASMRVKAQKNFKIDSDNAFHERMQRLGTAGAVIQTLDGFQKAVWQKRLSKWSGTLSKMVLQFPLFPAQEAAETAWRQSVGQGSLGLLDEAAYNGVLANFKNAPRSLIDDLENRTIRGTARSRASVFDEDNTFNVGKALLDKLEAVGAKGFTDKLRKDGSLRFLTPDGWTEAATRNSLAGRRKYHYSRTIKHSIAELADNPEFSDLLKHLEMGSELLPPKVRDQLSNELAVMLLTGDEKAIRGLAGSFTGAKFQKKEAFDLIDNFAGANEWSLTTKEIAQQAVEGGTTSQIDDVVQNMIDSEFKTFTEGVGGFEAQLDLSIDTINEQAKLFDSLPVDELGPELTLQAEGTIREAISSLDNMERRITQILSRASVRARELAFKEGRKLEIHAQAQRQVNATLHRMISKKAEYVEALANLERKAFDSPVGYANNFQRQMDVLEAGWREDRAAVSELFERFKDQPKGESFWDEFAQIRDGIQTRMQLAKRQAQDDLDLLREQTLRRRGVKLPKIDHVKISKEMEGKTAYGLTDLATMAGMQPENITQAIMKSIWLNRTDFVDFFARRANRNNIRNIDPQKIGEAYDRTVKALGFSRSVDAGFLAQKQAIRQFGDQLKATAKAPSFRPEQEAAVVDFVNRAADLIPGREAALKEAGEQAVGRATEDLGVAFVNYDQQRSLDDFMQSLFPFWTYESRRMPFLLRTSLTNPVVWNTFGPEGRYWSNTDDGYIHSAVAPWADINPFAGTLLNAPRRLKKGDMPPEHEGGVRGAISSFEQQIAQGGFYFGPHMTFLFDAVLTGDLAEAAGQTSPPPVTGGLAGAQWIADTLKIPVLGDGLRKMRFSVMPDKFRDYEAAKIIWDMGLNPAEVDFEKWEPRPGAAITQEEINEALRRSAGVEWVRESSGMVRFRGEAEREYRTARDEIQMAWTGLSKKEIDEAKRQGISLTSIVPMPPEVARTLNELEGAEQFNAAVTLLSSGEKARLESLGREMWDAREALKTDADQQQAADDLAWFSGDMAPSVWRDRLGSRKQAIGGFIDQLRGVRTDPTTGEKVVIDPDARYREVPTTYDEYVELQKKLGNDTIRIQHPTSQALEMYYSISPVDRDGDGVPEWNEFFKNREAVLAQLPPELRRDVLDEIDRTRTEPERALAQMQRGILGRYWEIDDEVATAFGIKDTLLRDLRIANSHDPELAERLRQLPVMSRYRKEVQRRKDALRLQSPELDYALNIFGFTGDTLRFKNPQARLWWDRGNGVQRNVPFLGNLTGNEAPA